MKILIIGSKGFIGSHCQQYFTGRGLNVFGCDVVVDYTAEKYFLVGPSDSNFQDIFRTNAFDYCLNCSGAASVPDSFSSPHRDYLLNVLNVGKILEAIKVFSPQCKFLNLSSAAVYGNPTAVPVKEDFPANPISPYGYHKLSAEKLCEEYSRFFNIKTCNVRIFSAYGPGLKKQLFWDLYKKSKQGKELSLFGTGNESRDFVFVGDVVRAVELILEKCNFSGDIINLASGKEINISDAVWRFFNVLKWDGVYAFKGEERPGDPLRWQADISKLKELGFEPSYSLEEGLNEYVKWLKELK